MMVSLKCSDFPVDFGNAFPIHRPDDMWPDSFLAIYFDLEEHVHIHFIKSDQLIAPVAISMHRFILFDNFSKASQKES